MVQGHKKQLIRKAFAYIPLYIIRAAANAIPSNISCSSRDESSTTDIELSELVPKTHYSNPEVADFKGPTHVENSPKMHSRHPTLLHPREPSRGFVHLLHMSPPRTEFQEWQHDRRNSNIPTPTAAPSPALRDNSMCVFLGAALGICNSLTPGFTAMGPSMQAQCLCYSSAIWSPNVFDNAVNKCAAFASTAVPAAYNPLANLEGFCAGMGNVKGPKSTLVVVTSTTSALGESTTGNLDCDLVSDASVSCMQKHTDFNDLDVTGKAKCLCYDSNTSWRPTIFDNAVKACAGKTAHSSLFPSVAPLVNLCAAMGDVLRNGSFITYTTSMSATPTSLSLILPSTTAVPISTTLPSQFPSSTASNSTLRSSVVSASTYPYSWVLFSKSTATSILTSTPSTQPLSSFAATSSKPTFSLSTTSSQIIHTLTIIPSSTTTSANPPTSGARKEGRRRELKIWEIVWISYCIAMTLSFLC